MGVLRAQGDDFSGQVRIGVGPTIASTVRRRPLGVGHNPRRLGLSRVGRAWPTLSHGSFISSSAPDRTIRPGPSPLFSFSTACRSR